MHKNMEDNYGAVISANHEALAQILEQVKMQKCQQQQKSPQTLVFNTYIFVTYAEDRCYFKL